MSTHVRPGRELLRRVGGTRRWVALSSTLGIITIGAGIGLVAMAVSLLTRSALFGSTVSLSLTILGVRFFAVTRVVGRYCERYFGHLGTFRVVTRIRVWFFSGLLSTDSMQRAQHRRGDVVTALVDDVETMQDRLLRVSTPVVVATGTLLIGISSLLMIDPTSAVILACAFLTEAIALPPLLRARSRGTASSLVELRARRTTETTEFLDGLETLTIWGRPDLLEGSLTELDRQEASLRTSLAASRAVLDGAVVAITGACVIAILVSLHRSITSNSELWWIAAAPLIALATFEALGPLLAVPEHRTRTDAAATRVLATFADRSRNTPPASIDETAEPSETIRSYDLAAPAIVLDSVSFSYDGMTKILRDASLTIPFGETIAIAAPTGAGKSTLLDLLLGFLAPDQGTIAIGGENPCTVERRGKPSIVAVMQDDHLFDTTIRDNLLVGDGDADDEWLRGACDVAGLRSFLDSRGDELESSIGSNGDRLSGGERQRLMIARAIVADAPILILDEATEHLEPELRSALLSSVLDARRGRTTILLAHEPGNDVNTRVRADAVYDLRGGTFVQRDP